MTQFNIRKDIQDIINVGIFRKFAKQHGVEHQGNKNILVRNIVLAVRSGQIPEEAIREFLQEQIWYGRNKHIFYIEVAGTTVEIFKDTETLLEYFTNRGVTPFNNIDRIYIPDGISLVRFEYEVNESNPSVVNKVFLGFIEKNYTYHYEGHTLAFHAVNTYICSEIDLINNLLIMRIRSRARLKPTQDIDSQNVTSMNLAKKYLDRFQENYGFEYLSGVADEMKNTMFNIERQLTNFIKLQFQPKVMEYEALINDFTTRIASELGLPSDTDPINLPERIVGLLERSLIVLNEESIESYVEGKVGYVNMFDFKDDRGGRISARSKNHITPIQTSDIFFDTKETINEVKLLDSLWVVWFKTIDGEQEANELLEIDIDCNEEDETDNEVDDLLIQGDQKVIRIKTKMAAYRGFYKIDFKRYVLKEEYNHVLSLIESFKGL